MILEPSNKKAIVFIDGQNFFYGIKEAFGYTYPNFNVVKLATAVCGKIGWYLHSIRFYTGVPDVGDNPKWHAFWTAKLASMGRQGVIVYSRPLRYRNKTVKLPDGNTHTFLVGQEKGVDIRIALDMVRAVRENSCDVVVVISQDQDLSEVAEEVRLIAKEQERWVKIASAYPVSPTAKNIRGVNKTDWIKIDRILYDNCIDPRDFFSQSP